ncbi:unnamed protein product [Mytilus coruscus]|uniref:HYR domain-containing protein n=1 Tax=Mytilus coruscus TaxID=42192 RepID=A0A6J8E0P1_MYTCO|nr:unnamed protein product [Mytilus coruscus]
MTAFTSELTKTLEWSVPEFIDPNNETLEVFSNYPESKWTFPWGDFNVSYLALKQSNGLRTECLFEIRVRPYPCNDIAAPTNGAILCNNWRKDFGQFCVHLCQESYTVGRGINPNNIYVCGASGLWLPSSNSPDCNVIVSSLLSTDGYIIANSYKNCTMDIKTMQSFYITNLKESMFSYFCDKFPDECIEENTDVRCS